MRPKQNSLTPVRRDILIRIVAHRDEIPLRLADISKAVGLGISTVQHHLRSLVQSGMLEQEPYCRYIPTARGVEACTPKQPTMPGGKARKVAKCPNCGHRLYVS